MAATSLLAPVGGDLTTNPVRELVRRFAITFLLGVVVFRFVSFVPIPGVDVIALQSNLKNREGGEDPIGAIIKYADMFNGGAIRNASIFGLGIMPYISASIILQVLAFSIPSLKALQKEGEAGRRKINQYTRYATVLICLVQSAVAAVVLLNSRNEGQPLVVTDSRFWFVVQSMLVITTGSLSLLWLAEQITRFGIGNGVSVIIMVGILSYIPTGFAGMDKNLGEFLLIALLSLSIIAAIVLVIQATRKINLEQQRRVQGNKIYGGASTTLPLKLNQANVVPVIFASPVLVLISFVMRGLGNITGVSGLDQIVSYGGVGYRYLFGALIVAFTFFYISITFDLNELANHFKQAGFFVRGIKPGKNTVEFLSYHLMRITFVGAIFLAVIAVMPQLLSDVGLAGRAGNALLGGTGLLIVVGVALDIMQKVGSFFLAHQFQGQLGDGLGMGAKKQGKRF